MTLMTFDDLQWTDPSKKRNGFENTKIHMTGSWRPPKPQFHMNASHDGGGMLIEWLTTEEWGGNGSHEVDTNDVTWWMVDSHSYQMSTISSWCVNSVPRSALLLTLCSTLSQNASQCYLPLNFTVTVKSLSFLISSIGRSSGIMFESKWFDFVSNIN